MMTRFMAMNVADFYHFFSVFNDGLEVFMLENGQLNFGLILVLGVFAYTAWGVVPIGLKLVAITCKCGVIVCMLLSDLHCAIEAYFAGCFLKLKRIIDDWYDKK